MMSSLCVMYFFVTLNLNNKKNDSEYGIKNFF